MSEAGATSRRRRVTAGLLVILLTAGCGTVDPGGAADGAAADDRYGYGPKPDRTVVYQPDVVLVAGGSKAVRSVRKDGFTYVIDGKARGIADVAPGKIMFATSEVVGRVVRVERSGGDKAVTLAPVRLTDVVRDGHFRFDQPLDVAAQTFGPLPDLLGEVDDGNDDGDAATPAAADAGQATGVAATDAADFRLAVPPIVIAPTPEPGSRGATSYQRKVGNWHVVAYKDASKVGLTASHATAAKRLKVDFDIQLQLRNLRVWGDVRVTNGVVPHPQFRIDGIEGLAVTIAAGAEGGLDDNKKVKVELPIEVTQPIVIGGFPATLKQTFKFLVSTAFSAKNGNLKATGRWGLDGPVGYVRSTVLTPTFSVRDSIMESIRGVSIGVEGIVVAAEFRFGFLLGLPVAGAGPFVGIVASVGVTNGSAAGRVGLPLPAGPGVKCRGSTLVLTVRAGEGISISEPLAKAIERVLKVDIPKEAAFITKDIVNRTVVEPDVPLCRG